MMLQSYSNKYKYAFIIIVLLIVPTLFFLNLTRVDDGKDILVRKKIVLSNWVNIYQSYKTTLNQPTAYPAVLYNVQISTNLFFDYAYQLKDYQILDQLAELYLIPYDHLHTQGFVWVYENGTYKAKNLPSPVKIWGTQRDLNIPVVNMNFPAKLEGVLNSSQFLYLIARATNKFLDIPSSKRTSNMNNLIDKYADILVNDHYKRWLIDTRPFQVSAWGCNPGNFSHRDFMYAKQWNHMGSTHNFSYCNSLSDTDMWIFSGILETLAAHNKAPNRIPISASLKNEMKLEVSTGMSFLTLRLTDVSLLDFSGNSVTGQNLDAGSWTDHADMQYAGYEGETFPNSNDQQTVSEIAFDISHARRLVQVMRTLQENKATHGYSFPLTSDFEKLANQVVYGIFNGDMVFPLFHNFWNGSNGWYRVNYAGRTGFGYAPFDMSLEFLRSGYCSWKRHNTDLNTLCNRLWTMMNHKGGQLEQATGRKQFTGPQLFEDKLIKHRNKYYSHCLYMNGQRHHCGDNFQPDTSVSFFNFITAYDAYAKPPLRLEYIKSQRRLPRSNRAIIKTKKTRSVR